MSPLATMIRRLWTASPRDYSRAIQRRLSGGVSKLAVMENVAILTTVLGVSEDQARTALDELYSVESDLVAHCFSQFLVHRRKPWPIEGRFALLYALVRLTKPACVVETGVFDGVSSAIILAALARNNRGTLYSIDLPAGPSLIEKWGDDLPRDHSTLLTPDRQLPLGQQPGWIVPEGLRSRHRLIAGDARVELPKLCDELKTISIFIHDSLHTYRHMQFEFATVLPYLEQDGLLCSDDCFWNSAYEECLVQNAFRGATDGHFGVAKRIPVN